MIAGRRTQRNGDNSSPGQLTERIRRRDSESSGPVTLKGDHHATAFPLPDRRTLQCTPVVRPWEQLTLRLPIRRLIRAASHFVWTRPDGKQFVCRTFRQLVARVYDYDGHLLQGLLRSVTVRKRA